MVRVEAQGILSTVKSTKWFRSEPVGNMEPATWRILFGELACVIALFLASARINRQSQSGVTFVIGLWRGLAVLFHFTLIFLSHLDKLSNLPLHSARCVIGLDYRISRCAQFLAELSKNTQPVS
jgi:hypothetical protein